MLNNIARLEKESARTTPDIGHDMPIFMRGRLTLASGDPLPSTDSPALANTLYFTPYVGCYEFSEISLDFTALAANNYDIFYKDHALSYVAWTDEVTRSVALTRYQGFLSLSTDTQKRYIGTVRRGTNELLDRVLFRYVWNNYNREPRNLYCMETTSHTYNGAERLWNNSTVNNQLQVILGLSHCIFIHNQALIRAGADGSYAYTRIYINGVPYATPGVDITNNNVQNIRLSSSGWTSPLPVGRMTLNMYESGNHASSTFTSMTLAAMVMA